MTHHRACPTCSWTGGPYATPGIADYAQRSHRCATHHAADARTARARATEAAIDRTPQPCRHPRANHQHGTYRAYHADRCRCLPCTLANSREQMRLARARGYYGANRHLVDAQPVRDHLAQLRTAGVGFYRLGELTGIDQASIQRIIAGRPGAGKPPPSRVTRATADRILAVTLDQCRDSPHALVPAHGARLRARALVALGWPFAEQARRIGRNPKSYHDTINGADTITRATHDAIVDLYDQIGMTIPPQTTRLERIAYARARNLAARNRWQPPLALNDDKLDDPTYRPRGTPEKATTSYDESVVTRRLDGDRGAKMSTHDRKEIVRRARHLGWTLSKIEQTTGITRAERYLEQPGTPTEGDTAA